MCQTCPIGKFAKPVHFSTVPYYDTSSSPTPYGGSNCTKCRDCSDPQAIPIKECLPGSFSDMRGGCICQEGYFISNWNSTDPFNIMCIACKSCSSMNAVLQNPCTGLSAVDTTTGCICPFQNKKISIFNVTLDPYAINCTAEPISGPISGPSPSPSGPSPSPSGSITIINNYVTVIVFIFQFQAPYQLSEVTDEVKSKMRQAVADILNVNASDVIITVSSIGSRRRALQSAGVTVGVSLKNFDGSSGIFASRSLPAEIDLLRLR